MRFEKLRTGYAIFAGMLACSSVKYPSLPPSPASLPTERPALGIILPDIRLDSPQPWDDHRLGAYQAERELDAAVRAIYLLRATGLFSEVDFVCSLGEAPNVVLRIEPPIPKTSDEADSEFTSFFFWLLTFGIVPMVESERAGFSAKIEGRDNRLLFDWPRKRVTGWAALMLHPLPEWHFDESGEHTEVALAYRLANESPEVFDRSSWLDQSEINRLTRRCN